MNFIMFIKFNFPDFCYFSNFIFFLILHFLQESESDDDYSGDYENSGPEKSGNTSRLQQQPIFLILASVLTFLQTLKY